MMFDTDILSMLGKVGRANLLRELFPETNLAISFEVYNELLTAKEAGYDFVDDILNQRFRIMYLDSHLTTEYERRKEKWGRSTAPGMMRGTGGYSFAHYRYILS